MPWQAAFIPKAFISNGGARSGEERWKSYLSEHVRCDCLTRDYSIEFDFAEKWVEAVGESLYYSKETGKKAGIVLILETKEDFKFWLRMNETIQYHNLPIETWIVTPADVENKRAAPQHQE